MINPVAGLSNLRFNSGRKASGVQAAASTRVAVGRADDVVAWGRVGVPADPVGDGAGSTAADAVVVEAAVGDVLGPDCDGCVQPANEVALAVSTTTTIRIRLNISDHPYPALAGAVLAPCVHRWRPGQRQHRWQAIRM
jgi:hypothetical protein